MRRILNAGAALLGLVAIAAPAHAEWQPTRNIKLICPFPAGGGTDQIARIVALQLSKRLGQQVVVENRGGANGGLGAQEVMRADPDGYTLGAISDSPMTVNPWMYEKLAYSPAGLHRRGADQSFPVAGGRQPLDRHQDHR